MEQENLPLPSPPLPLYGAHPKGGGVQKINTMADDNLKKMVTLRSSDKVEFKVSEAVVCKSQVLRRMIEDDCAQDAVPLYNVHSETLSRVIEYCTTHVKGVHTSKRLKTEEGPTPTTDQELKQWDAEFINVDPDALYDLVNAANYLEIGDLLDLMAQKVAEIITGKSPDEIRKTFNPYYKKHIGKNDIREAIYPFELLIIF